MDAAVKTLGKRSIFSAFYRVLIPVIPSLNTRVTKNLLTPPVSNENETFIHQLAMQLF